MTKRKFIIYVSSYDAESGGVMVLHELCDRLNQLGHEAAIWPVRQPLRFHTMLSAGKRRVKRLIGLKFRGFDTGPYARRIAQRREIAESVVVYPEVVAGNPLGAARVVRWLLFKPGQHTGVINYGPNDVIFFYNDAFDDPALHSGRDHLLRVTYRVSAYRKWNDGARSGSCFIVRKGGNRPLDAHPADAIPVDDLSHEERAAVFNRVDTCYCYDLYTYLAIYAAVCGCVPIIVPESGLTEEQWQSDEINRLGRAYGESRVEWAKATRLQLIATLEERRRDEDAQVRDFVALCGETLR